MILKYLMFILKIQRTSTLKTLRPGARTHIFCRVGPCVLMPGRTFRQKKRRAVPRGTSAKNASVVNVLSKNKFYSKNHNTIFQSKKIFSIANTLPSCTQRVNPFLKNLGWLRLKEVRHPNLNFVDVFDLFCCQEVLH